MQLARVPRKWTPVEDTLLQDKVEQCRQSGKATCWGDIAAAFQDRTNNDCRKRWVKMDEKWKRGVWDSREEEQLRQGVQAFGHRWVGFINVPPDLSLIFAESWTDISGTIGTRSPDQCAKHWRNSLDPKISHSDWTGEEDRTLTEAVQNHGHDWKVIREKFFPERSRLDLSNRYVSLTRQHRRKRPRSSSVTAATQEGQKTYRDAETERLNHQSIQDSHPQQQSSSVQTLKSSPGDNQSLVTSWMSHGLNADTMEGLATATFHTATVQSDGRETLAYDGLFDNMGLNHKCDDNSLIFTSNHSSTSLFPFTESTLLTSELFDTHGTLMEISPVKLDAVIPRKDHHQSGFDLDTWPTLTDRSPESPATPSQEATTTPSSAGVPSTQTLSKRGKTILTLENLDPETRGEIVDLLCKRKIITTIEIE
ncbi:hypothetical protein MMC17_008272 [Xylographa soralifera]|nr:hypothetical protein [Xylographa soralifera]